MRRERALWAGVLITVYNDLISTKVTKEAVNNRRDAIRWLGSRPSAQFERICQMAGVEADATHERLTRIAQLSIAERSELCYMRISFDDRLQAA